MPQSFSSISLHLVWSTKDRRLFLHDADILARTHAHLAKTARDLKCRDVLVGGVADHVHLHVGLPRDLCVSDLVRDLKRSSSKSIKTMSPALKFFAWQTGYGAFSLSLQHRPQVKAYIRGQEEHHRTVSYQDEFRQICRRNGVEVDEEHAWL